MSISPLDGLAWQALQLALDASSLRQQTIATNLANANTIDYAPLRVSFEERLQQELHTLSAQSSATVPTLQTRARLEFDPQHFSVAADEQLAQLSQNHVQYLALLKAVNSKIELTSLAINEGRK